MNIEGKYFTETIPVTTHISIEKDRVVMRNNRNVLAFGCLNSNKDNYFPLHTRFYSIKPYLEEIFEEVFPILLNGESVEKEISIPLAIQTLPEYYLCNIKLLELLDKFSKENEGYTTIQLLELAQENRVLLVTSNEDPISFAVVDEDKNKIVATYVDVDYRDLGIETIYDMKELF